MNIRKNRDVNSTTPKESEVEGHLTPIKASDTTTDTAPDGEVEGHKWRGAAVPTGEQMGEQGEPCVEGHLFKVKAVDNEVATDPEVEGHLFKVKR